MRQPNLIRAWILTLSLIPATVALTFLVALLAGEAQQVGKAPRVGMLFLGSSSTQGVRAEIVREELRKLGYVEGQTITFEIRFANGRLDRVRGLATELVAARVDVIVTAGTSVLQEFRPVAGNIPIVATMVDPISAGFAESFARPGGNITGLAFEERDLATKLLQLLKEVVPGLIVPATRCADLSVFVSILSVLSMGLASMAWSPWAWSPWACPPSASAAPSCRRRPRATPPSWRPLRLRGSGTC